MARSTAAAALLGLALAGCAEPVRVEQRWQALGGEASVELYARTERTATEAVAGIAEAYERAERIFAGDDPDGELHRINATAPVEAVTIEDYELYHAIKTALDWARASAGAFDPTGGSWTRVVLYPEGPAVRFRDPGIRIDLEGLAIGYALDMGARNFARAGLMAALLRAGPVCYAWAAPPGRTSWEVPTELGVVSVRHRAVAVWRNGGSDSNVRVAVAIADTGASAQPLSRALVAMGSRRAGMMLERGNRIEAVLLVEGPEGPYLLASGSLRGRLSPDAALTARTGQVRYILPPVSPS